MHIYITDIQHGDVLAWPTNLGWMMGPWLIYASLINQGTIALYDGAPMEREFVEFVQNARVTMPRRRAKSGENLEKYGLYEGA